jgi:hypothetical protein
MQPYEIRQSRDGTIDYNSYYARPMTFVSPGLFRLCRQAASPKSLLLAAIAAAAIVFTASASTHRTVCMLCAPAITGAATSK